MEWSTTPGVVYPSEYELECELVLGRDAAKHRMIRSECFDPPYVPRICAALVDCSFRGAGWLLEEGALSSEPELRSFLTGAQAFITNNPGTPPVKRWGYTFLKLCRGKSPKDWISLLM